MDARHDAPARDGRTGATAREHLEATNGSARTRGRPGRARRGHDDTNGPGNSTASRDTDALQVALVSAAQNAVTKGAVGSRPINVKGTFRVRTERGSTEYLVTLKRIGGAV